MHAHTQWLETFILIWTNDAFEICPICALKKKPVDNALPMARAIDCDFQTKA